MFCTVGEDIHKAIAKLMRVVKDAPLEVREEIRLSDIEFNPEKSLDGWGGDYRYHITTARIDN
jgi:hypothetical protein